MRRILLIAATVLLLVACGASEDTSGQDVADTSTTAASDTATTTTTAPEATTTVQEADTGGGDFSVVMVSGVDTLTANGQLDDLKGAGFDAFAVTGSDDTGFTVYQSGLSESEAEELLQQVRDALFGGSDIVGLVGETEVWVPGG